MVRVDVTQECIDAGDPSNSKTCPVAYAANQIDHLHRVEVNPYIIEFVYLDQHYLIDLPMEAVEFIHQFDSGKYVEPFSFEIELPEKEDV